VAKQAVCIRCGAWKRWPPERCRDCGFEPSEERDLSKSLYLSKARPENADEPTDIEALLEQASATLRSGGTVQYDADELQRLSERLRDFRSVSSRQVWATLLRFFLPGILFLAALFGLLYLLRSGGV